MYNGKEIRKVLKKAAVEPKKPDPFGKDVSMYGYRDDSPFRDSPSLNIFTKDGTIDMSNTGIPILANNRFLPPYSGTHQFDTKMVHEIPLAQKGRQVVHTDKAAYDKAYKAEMDSAYLYKHPISIDYSDVNYDKKNSLVNPNKYKQKGISPISWDRSGDEFSAIYKKPLIHNVYEELVVKPVKEQPKKVEAKKDYATRNVDFNSSYGAVMKYYDESGNLIRTEPYTPQKKEGGWLDKYQDKGEVKGSWLPSQLRQGPDPGPPKVVDKRKLPQSGVVVDKRTNQAYYAGDKGETGTFPVLTGQNPNANVNPHNLDYLSKHPEARATPRGYYMMNKAAAAMPKFVAKEYENKVRNIDGIPAFGFPAPTAADLAAHWTFGKHEDPKEYARREKLYQCPPGKRWTSYGCVNMQASSFDAMNEAIPDPDTLMVLDSKYAADQALLKEMQSRMKEDGGESWVYDDDFYRMGGFNRTRLKREKRPKTSKNIATSINFLQQRNEMIFGPSGRHLYDPNTKGWLDKYK